MNGKVELDGVHAIEPAWQTFHQRNVEWADCQAQSDGVAYCLPQRVLRDALSLFQLSETELAAESDFSALCDKFHAIGWSDSRPVRYPLLNAPLPLPKIDDPSRLLQLGWSQSQVDWLLKGGVPRSDVFDRRRASAGRLIVSPDFVHDRDRLRSAWQSLPNAHRPRLPMNRPATTAGTPEAWSKLPKAASQFWSTFEEFCVRWQVGGMVTWELPDPEGPNWSATFTPEQLKEQGTTQVCTPWHFPLKQADNVGELAFDDHLERSSEHGIEDHNSWQTYAQFLPLDHWNRVFSDRYPKRRVKSFRTKLEYVLASQMGISVDRVQRLYKWLKALRTGKMTTLYGRR